MTRQSSADLISPTALTNRMPGESRRRIRKTFQQPKPQPKPSERKAQPSSTYTSYQKSKQSHSPSASKQPNSRKNHKNAENNSQKPRPQTQHREPPQSVFRSKLQSSGRMGAGSFLSAEHFHKVAAPPPELTITNTASAITMDTAIKTTKRAKEGTKSGRSKTPQQRRSRQQMGTFVVDTPSTASISTMGTEHSMDQSQGNMSRSEKIQDWKRRSRAVSHREDTRLKEGIRGCIKTAKCVGLNVKECLVVSKEVYQQECITHHVHRGEDGLFLAHKYDRSALNDSSQMSVTTAGTHSTEHSMMASHTVEEDETDDFLNPPPKVHNVKASNQRLRPPQWIDSDIEEMELSRRGQLPTDNDRPPQIEQVRPSVVPYKLDEGGQLALHGKGTPVHSNQQSNARPTSMNKLEDYANNFLDNRALQLSMSGTTSDPRSIDQSKNDSSGQNTYYRNDVAPVVSRDNDDVVVHHEPPPQRIDSSLHRLSPTTYLPKRTQSPAKQKSNLMERPSSPVEANGVEVQHMNFTVYQEEKILSLQKELTQTKLKLNDAVSSLNTTNRYSEEERLLRVSESSDKLFHERLEVEEKLRREIKSNVQLNEKIQTLQAETRTLRSSLEQSQTGNRSRSSSRGRSPGRRSPSPYVSSLRRSPLASSNEETLSLPSLSSKTHFDEDGERNPLALSESLPYNQDASNVATSEKKETKLEERRRLLRAKEQRLSNLVDTLRSIREADEGSSLVDLNPDMKKAASAFLNSATPRRRNIVEHDLNSRSIPNGSTNNDAVLENPASGILDDVNKVIARGSSLIQNVSEEKETFDSDKADLKSVAKNVDTDQMNTRIKHLESEVSLYKENELEWNQQKIRNRQRQEQLEGQVKAVQVELVDLRAQLAEAITERLEAQNKSTSLERENLKLQNETKLLKTELSQLRKQFESLQKNKTDDSDRLQTEIKDMTASLHKFQSDCRQMTRDKAESEQELSKIARHSERMNEEVRRLQEESAVLRTKMETTMTENDEIKIDKIRLSEELSTAKGEAQRLRSDVARFMNELQREKMTFERKLRVSEEEARSLQDELRLMKEKLAETNAEIVTQAQEHLSQRRLMESELLQTRGAAQTLQAKVLLMDDRIASAENEAEMLRKQKTVADEASRQTPSRQIFQGSRIGHFFSDPARASPM